MKKPFIIVAIALASLALAAGVANAGNDKNEHKDEYKKNVYVCHKTDSEKYPWIIKTVKDVVAPDFLYKGKTYDHKPVKDGYKWCKDNVPAPPVVTPPTEQTVPDTQGEPADASPTAMPEVGGHGAANPTN